jgi:hypothetical protein
VLLISAAGFWAVHGFHVALVVIPATVMGLALLVEQRRTEARNLVEVARADALRSSLDAAPGDWRGIAGPAPAPQGQVTAVPIAVAASVGAALVHVVVMPEHFSDSVLYGLFFLAAATVQIAWSWAAANRPSRLLLGAGAIGSAAVVLLWLATRTVGIPIGPDATSIEPVGARHHPRTWPSQTKGLALCMVLAVAAVAFAAPVN